MTVKDVRVQQGAECGSDHFLLRAALFFNNNMGKQIKEEDRKELLQSKEVFKPCNPESLKDESTKFLVIKL